jgi:hypothetical protein
LAGGASCRAAPDRCRRPPRRPSSQLAGRGSPHDDADTERAGAPTGVRSHPGRFSDSYRHRCPVVAGIRQASVMTNLDDTGYWETGSWRVSDRVADSEIGGVRKVTSGTGDAVTITPLRVHRLLRMFSRSGYKR